jgi:hypothetical protein
MVSSFRGFTTIQTSTYNNLCSHWNWRFHKIPNFVLSRTVILQFVSLQLFLYNKFWYCSHILCFEVLCLKYYIYFLFLIFINILLFHCHKIRLLSKWTTLIYQERLELSYCRCCHVSARIQKVQMWNVWLCVSTAVESNLLNLL